MTHRQPSELGGFGFGSKGSGGGACVTQVNLDSDSGALALTRGSSPRVPSLARIKHFLPPQRSSFVPYSKSDSLYAKRPNDNRGIEQSGQRNDAMKLGQANFLQPLLQIFSGSQCRKFSPTARLFNTGDSWCQIDFPPRVDKKRHRKSAALILGS